MKPIFCFTASLILLARTLCPGQGTIMIYDQQSTNLIEGAAPFGDSFELTGQSFTPALSSVAFVTLNLFDADSLHTNGATVLVSLRSNSISGPVLGSSLAVYMPNAFFGATNFSFTTPVPVIPGITYYFQPVIQSGDAVSAYVTDASYTGGSEILQGVPITDRNFWFREGTFGVPEPSAIALLLVGSGMMMGRFRRRRRL